MAAELNPYSAPRAPVGDAGGTQRDAVAGAQEGPRGIGGWLILPLLGLIVTPFRVGFESYRELLPALDAETWTRLTTPGSDAYHPLWASVIVFEVGVNVLLIVFSVLLLWQFLRKARRVPKLMVAWWGTLVGVQAVDLLLMTQIPMIASQMSAQDFKELLRAALGAAIWIPYFLVSRRVRNTFVEDGA